jgi:ATP-dependent RNA circularization protein (DNA/RNA ligase family)
MAIDLDIERKLIDWGWAGVALQGEIVGEGIQGNQYKRKPAFYLFDVYNSFEGSYEKFSTLQAIAAQLRLSTVPIISRSFPIEAVDIPFLLSFAEGKSQLNDSQREGLVFQCNDDPNKSFKVISNAWLLKNE